MDFIDLKSQQQRIKESIDTNITKVLSHGHYIMGPEVVALEKRLASYVGVKHCITASSGTDTLLIAMMALGVGHGDEVITTPFTFIATAEMIMLLGAIPVFVDVDAKTYNIDVTKIEDVITAKTKAIMPVALYGQCADMDEINEIARKYRLPVIEDAAQSFGATYKGRKSCGLSTVGSTSFYPSKPLGCYGEGGALFTNDDGLAEIICSIRGHGQNNHCYDHIRVGVNGRLDTFQAAILLAKMDVFDSEVESRNYVADLYNKFFENEKIVSPYVKSCNKSVYAQYSVQVNDRKSVQESLKRQGIPTAVHYPVPLNLQPVFGWLNQPVGSFPVAEAAASRVMSLPMHPYLDDESINEIAKKTLDALL